MEKEESYIENNKLLLSLENRQKKCKHSALVQEYTA